MANEKVDDELEALAFEIYKQAVAGGSAIASEQQALAAYHKAEAFISVRTRVRNGQLKAEKTTGPQLCDVRAPNLPRTHPHNLVSKVYGNLDRVRKIYAWLEANPTPEREPTELIPRLQAAFPDLSWDVPTINTARAIFPDYCKN